MPKHLENDIEPDNKYGKIISRQGVRLVYLEEQLIQERVSHIEDLQEIKYIAESNINNNQTNILGAIAGVIIERLDQLTGGIIQNKKEKNLHTDQDT